MSVFKVPVVKVGKVEPHPDADRLELAVIGGYRSVIGKGTLSPGDFVAYIPEGAVLPDSLIAELGLTGRLAGSGMNRVHAVRLRGVLSQGICYKGGFDRTMDDVSGDLGIVKYESEIPDCMKGDVVSVFGYVIPFDVEDSKRFPDTLEEGEMVFATEKIHGTQCVIGYCPNLADEPDTDFDSLPGGMIISSKGLAAKGLSFAATAGNLENNVYVSTVVRTGVHLRLREWAERSFPGDDVFLVCEIFGRGIQDLHYGAIAPMLAGLHVVVRDFDGKRFLDREETEAAFSEIGVFQAPVLYRGPFSEKETRKLAEGSETVSGKSMHVREGVVVTPERERRDEFGPGRVSLKFVGDGYLIRAGGTEYN